MNGLSIIEKGNILTFSFNKKVKDELVKEIMRLYEFCKIPSHISYFLKLLNRPLGIFQMSNQNTRRIVLDIGNCDLNKNEYLMAFCYACYSSVLE